MSENDTREGKNLAVEEKKKLFEQEVLQAIKDLPVGQVKQMDNGVVICNNGKNCSLNIEGELFGAVDSNGTFIYTTNKLLPNGKKVEQLLEEYGSGQEDKGRTEGNKPEEDKNQEEEIAKKLGIPSYEVYEIPEGSQFYLNHPGIFPNKDAFLYEDEKGKYRMGRLDEKGNPVEDTKNFNNNVQVQQMEYVYRRGDGRKLPTKEKPIQTIAMVNPAKGNTDKDVRDRFLAVFRGQYGEITVDEVEQSGIEGKLVGESIEISGRKRNTSEMNKTINNNRSGQTPEDAYDIFTRSKELIQKIHEDLTKREGPMNSDVLEQMTNEAIERLEKGEDYNKVIATVGVPEREEGGKQQGDKRNAG